MTNKKTLAKKLAKKTMLNQKEAGLIIDELFQIILDEVKKGEDISVTGFGKFFLYQHKPRPVRNPKTQEEMILDEYHSLRFKPSEIIKKKLKDKS